VVLEVVRLVQFSLKIFGYLGPNIESDGLICDSTQTALKQAQEVLGKELGNEENRQLPESGVYLVPKLMIFLLSSVIFAKNSLGLQGIPIPKDPFGNYQDLMKALGHFVNPKEPAPASLTPELLNQLEKANKKGSKIPLHATGKFGPNLEREVHDFPTFFDVLNNDRNERLRYIWLGKGKPQESSRPTKSYGSGLVGGSVGFLNRVSEGVAETLINTVDEIKEGYKIVKDKTKDTVRLPHKREKDKERERERERDRLSRIDNFDNTSQENMERIEPFPVLNQQEEPMPPSEVEEALLELKEKEFQAYDLLGKLEKLNCKFDAKIASLEEVYKFQVKLYENLLQKHQAQNQKNHESNLLLDTIEVGNAMLQYQSNVAESKLQETYESIENFSKMVSDLDGQVKKKASETSKLMQLLHFLFFALLENINRFIPLRFLPKFQIPKDDHSHSF